jgi:hypothetical protein
MLLLLVPTMLITPYPLLYCKPKNKETGGIFSTRVIPMEIEAQLSGSIMATQVSTQESPRLPVAMKV